jgi:site-specific DNA-methyltransferase (adenine-specific)
MKTKGLDPLIRVAEFSDSDTRGTIFAGEALDFLRTLPARSASIVFLDPPFNLGKEYKSGAKHLDNRPEQVYHKWLMKVLRESTRVVANGGALYLYHLPWWAMRLGAFLGSEEKLSFRHWIAISMKNGFVRGDRLYPAHYALLMYTRGEPGAFNRPKLRPVKCRHCHEYVKDYGGYTSIIEQKGINLSDFWEDLSPVRHANRKNRRANELPEALFSRIVAISGGKGGLFVDPFAGSGTGVVVAANSGLSFAACDIVTENCQLIAERLRRRRSAADAGSNC